MSTLTASPHLCILASAGSGKTFRLSSRFIELIARGESPSRIVASTFTRLAAGEIRDRLLRRLAEAVVDSGKRHELAKAIGVDLDEVSALAVLRRVARDLDRLQVRTLDSFFAGVVRTCVLELGLPPDPGLVDEAGEVLLRQRAIERLLETDESDRLVELMRVLTEGRADRSVMTAIDRAASSLHDVYRESGPAPWRWMTPRAMLNRVELDAAIAHLEQAVPTVNGHHVRAHGKDLARARASEVSDVDGWGDFVASGLAAKVLADETYYRHHVEPLVAAAYTPLLEHARGVIWNHLAWRTASTGQLLEMFDACVEHEKRRLGAVTFSDLTTLMVRAQQTSSLAEICFRLDAAVSHLLLDEFQDTSAVQWRALAPLAEEIVADGTGDRSFFCVGDIKQSIYGWRDAAPEILANLPELIAGPDAREIIGVEPLSRSYRSAPAVIDTVNAVFTGLAGNPAVARIAEAAAEWQGDFHEHTTAVTNREGVAELRVSRMTGDEPRLAEAAALAADLATSDPERSIGVLVRSNKSVGRLLFELSPARLDVPATGRGGGVLSDAAPVNAVLDLLRLADHPEHTIAAFNVARSPLGPFVGLEDHRSSTRRIEIGRRVRRRLLEDGYAATVQAWTFGIAPRVDRRELARLHQLVEIASAFDAGRPGLRPADFVSLALARSVDDPTGAAITVMNFHQSKGLEFDTVILPDLEWGVGRPGGDGVAVDRDGPAGPITAVVSWMRSGRRAALPELAPLFNEHVRAVARENLSLLYVAMTRAARRLVMYVDPGGQSRSGPPGTAAGIVTAALAPGVTLTPGEVLYTAGVQEPQPEPDLFAFAKTVSDTAGVPGARLAPRGDRPRIARPPSAHVNPAGRLANALRLDDGVAADRGTLIHALLEQMHWLEDFDADRETLTRIARRVTPRRPAAWIDTQVGLFLDLLETPALRELLRRGVAGDGRTVHREHPFARIVDGALQRGTIDRLEITRDGTGHPTAARIIDFKTDELPADETPERAETYRPQLESYREAVAEQVGVEPGSIEMLVAFVRAGVVVGL